MTPGEAGLAVLREAAGETLHWTVIWDRALRAGTIDPLADRDARDRLLRDLRAMARDGVIERVATGSYRVSRAVQDPG